jgi:leader peptidase (prepilin peptidase) / N-methyltransferase
VLWLCGLGKPLEEGCWVFNFINWPIELRIALILVGGLISARFINWAIYTWAYFPRKLGPWCLPDPSVKPVPKSSKGKSAKKVQDPFRTWRDHVPVLGWWNLRRESDLHGERYWLRPLMIELIFPLLLAWYYRFQLSGGGLPPGAAKLMLPLAPQLHFQFVGHWILFMLITIATFIDFDEHTIPDLVTIPGTIIGVIGSALAPIWLPLVAGPLSISEMHCGWPREVAPMWLSSVTGLVVAILILVVWGFALLERRVIMRRGVRKALIYFWARMFRHPPLWITVLVSTAVLVTFVVGCWYADITRWNMLMSSLLGLAFAGGITWAARISASYGYGVEALGFGDVTLMAMIGAFVGWQPSLAVFFVAPFVAFVFVLIRWFITGNPATPYGPYLCSAVLLLLVFWDQLWTNRIGLVFWMAEDFAVVFNKEFGLNLTGADLVLIGMAVCVLLIGGMLWLWMLCKRKIFGMEPMQSSKLPV